MEDISLYIVKKDLRIHDNSALIHASRHANTIIVYIYEDHVYGAASKWWLHHALNDFSNSLIKLGFPLIIRRGAFADELRSLLTETKATAVYWNRDYHPTCYDRDRQLMDELQKEGISVNEFEASLLLTPWAVKKSTGEGYKVFTPFYKQFMKEPIPAPLPALTQARSQPLTLSTLTINDLQLLPTIPWDSQFTVHQPTESGGLTLFQEFLEEKLERYELDRDFPAKQSTSQLSSYLAFGQLSPRWMWQALLEHEQGQQAKSFLRQLVWREFSYHLLYQEPTSLSEPFNKKFLEFRWEENEDHFNRWCKGQTGYPIVDAGMRELWQTGIMHNRVRMIVASFLTKHLLIPWQKGASWFWDTLVDADIANNTFGWQWVAGTGADAAPYFRIFNPTLQGSKFDPEGEYIKKWLPELSGLPAKYIHEPHKAPLAVLQEAAIILGQTYPHPIVDHKQARLRALERYNGARHL